MWNDEAFSIWKEWSRVYPLRGATQKLLGAIADEYWLVNVVHHEYMRPQALWELLLEDL